MEIRDDRQGDRWQDAFLPAGTLCRAVCRGRVGVEESSRGGEGVRAVPRSPAYPADRTVTLIHRASGLRTRLDLAAGRPHLVEIR
ncbi:hypothetical protein ACU635_49345 [[Actinomadura] parvosata]|uniref:hypothetical protein n=1 Tax=[Actinomadura] parvosata TaxID=1955412 RepID=UPI00406CFF5D